MTLQFDSTGKVIVPPVSVPLGEDNLVFKCHWNDAGWKGICSKKAREFNVSKNHKWCCDKRNECKKLIENKQQGSPCYESRLFLDFKMGAGSYLSGDKGLAMEDKYIRGAQKGKLAFLTTVSPETESEERYFIGIFDIEKIEKEKEVHGNKETSIIISPKIKLKFWDYFKNKDDSKKWSSGLFRYVNDEVALKILIDLQKAYNDLPDFEKEKKNLQILIKRYKEYLEN